MDEEKKPKILPPSLRERKRYLVFNILSEEKTDYGDFVKAFWNSMIGFMGEIKSAEAKVWLVQNMYNEENQTGIIKVAHDFVEELRTVLALISIVGEKKVVVKILGVTGTIKSAKNKYLSAAFGVL